MKAYALLLPLVACLSLAGVHYYRAQSDALGKLSEDVSRLRADMAQSPDPATAPPQQTIVVERTTVVPAATLSAAASPRPSAPEDGPKHMAEVRSFVDTEFAVQKRDTRWSAGAEKTISEKMKSILAGDSVVHEVDCRESMCRVEVAHGDYNEGLAFTHKLTKDPETRAWNGGAFAALSPRGDDGKYVGVLYIAREGEQLPTPDLQTMNP